MSAGDGATTDFGEEERLRRAIDRTPRRPTDLRFTRTNHDALKYSSAMQQRSGSCRVQPLVGRRVTIHFDADRAASNAAAAQSSDRRLRIQELRESSRSGRPEDFRSPTTPQTTTAMRRS